VLDENKDDCVSRHAIHPTEDHIDDPVVVEADGGHRHPDCEEDCAGSTGGGHPAPPFEHDEERVGHVERRDAAKNVA
jgi:hypothetical protein